MQPYQQRVVNEKIQIDEKFNNLTAFIDQSPVFGKLPHDEQERLQRQAGIMQQYSCVLRDRIEAFK